MQTICTSLQTDNHTSTLSLYFYRPDATPDAQPTVSTTESLKACFSKFEIRNDDIVTGEPRVQHFEIERQNETIDYNERFSWDNAGWLVNRAFFGPYGEIARVICTHTP